MLQLLKYRSVVFVWYSCTFSNIVLCESIILSLASLSSIHSTVNYTLSAISFLSSVNSELYPLCYLFPQFTQQWIVPSLQSLSSVHSTVNCTLSAISFLSSLNSELYPLCCLFPQFTQEWIIPSLASASSVHSTLNFSLSGHSSLSSDLVHFKAFTAQVHSTANQNIFRAECSYLIARGHYL